MESYNKAGAAGGGEVRRIDVVYFLSRGGRTDHPHLFRVNHRSGRAGGVRLRDVKRWLSEIRGKDMPGNFSWSYKRKYKGGYVWQDLKDDDLITPVSDNQYMLKGCDVRGTPPCCVQAPPKTPSSSSSSLDEKSKRGPGDDKDEKTTTCGDHNNDRTVEVVLARPDDDSEDESSPKPPPADDSPGGGSGEFKAVEVSRSQDLRDHQGQSHRRQEPEVKQQASVVASSSPAPEEQQQEEVRQQQGAAGIRRRSHDAVAGKQQAARRIMRVPRALHNILTCGGAADDADDAALRTVARRQHRTAVEAGGCGDDWKTPPTPTCPGMDGCGLGASRKARLRRGGKEQQPQGRRDGGKRDVGGAHKPAPLPRCSQCGKEFKPQDLHSHMQSCRGFKERMKSSTGSRFGVADNYSAGRKDDERRSRPGHCSQSQEQPSSASAVFLLTGS